MTFDPQRALAAVEASVSLPLDELGKSFAEAIRCAADDLGTVQLSPIGRRFALEELRRCATSRARLLAAPETATSPQIVVITGWPRTGSTVLHHLLALTPGWWAPDLATGLAPLEARASAEESARQRLQLLDRVAPQFRARHPMQTDWPEECITLLGSTGHTMLFQMFFDLPNYSQLLEDADWTSVYREHFSFIRAVAPPDANTIVLKAPGHLAHLPQLHETFPDTKVVRLWRPFDEMLASWTALVASGRNAMSTGDPHRIAAEWDRRWREAAEFGNSVPASVDIDYDNLKENPAAAAASVVTIAGGQPDSATTAWARWLARHPREHFGHVPVP
jgi:hypothetical protein